MAQAVYSTVFCVRITKSTSVFCSSLFCWNWVKMKQLSTVCDGLVSHLKSSTWAKILAGGAVAVIATVVLKKRRKAIRKQELRTLWDSQGKDVVTVHMFPRAVGGLNPSPFPVKVETYLRIVGIKYVADFEAPLSAKGKCPWITVNGVDVADSQLAIEYLTKKFGKDIESHLSPTEKAISRSLRCLMEDHLLWCVALERWVYAEGEDALHFMSFYFGESMPNWVQRMMVKKIGTNGVLPAAKGQGMGRHTREEVEEIGKGDLRAVSDFLADKKYLLGDRPCIADLTLFGFISVYLILPENSKSVFKRYIESDCRNLLRHHDTIRKEYWPDYEQLRH